MPIRILSEADIFLRFRKKVKTQILYLLGGLGVVAAGFELTLAVGSIPHLYFLITFSITFYVRGRLALRSFGSQISIWK